MLYEQDSHHDCCERSGLRRQRPAAGRNGEDGMEELHRLRCAYRQNAAAAESFRVGERRHLFLPATAVGTRGGCSQPKCLTLPGTSPGTSPGTLPSGAHRTVAWHVPKACRLVSQRRVSGLGAKRQRRRHGETLWICLAWATVSPCGVPGAAPPRRQLGRGRRIFI